MVRWFGNAAIPPASERRVGAVFSANLQRFPDQRAVFFLPSYFEGFPNALLEAMARGLAAVCTDVGAVPDAVDDGVNGFLVPPKDTMALVTAIEHYLRSPELVREHGRAGLARVAHFHDRDANLKRLFACLEPSPRVPLARLEDGVT